jgi:hypothetical protein
MLLKHGLYLKRMSGGPVFSKERCFDVFLERNKRMEHGEKDTTLNSSSSGTTTLSRVSVCSATVEHSQQEGFRECRCQRHVKPPTWRRTAKNYMKHLKNQTLLLTPKLKDWHGQGTWCV